MIVGGAVLPHPPIILPSFAGRRGDEVDATIRAVSDACDWIAGLRPDRLVVSSPHLGHGFDVPLAFVEAAMGRLPPTDSLLTDELSYSRYRELGRRLGDRERGTRDRVVLVISGDCSHRLSPQGPYGFHELGARLDAAIVEGVSRADVDGLLGIDPTTLREGAECGLRSFIFGLSAIAPAHSRVRSYEAPYGVGYLVATLEPTPVSAGANRAEVIHAG